MNIIVRRIFSRSFWLEQYQKVNRQWHKWRDNISNRQFRAKIVEKIVLVACAIALFLYWPHITSTVWVLWGLHQLYKRIGRRCECGEFIEITRVQKMQLARDEKTMSFKSPSGKFRWWIRRVFTVTFSVCEVCKRNKKNLSAIKVCKIGTGPVSIIHVMWVKNRHPEQFILEGEYSFALDDFLKRNRSIDELNRLAHTDAPPLFPGLDD